MKPTNEKDFQPRLSLMAINLLQERTLPLKMVLLVRVTMLEAVMRVTQAANSNSLK